MKKFIRLLIGSGENCADIRYITGISTPDDFIFFEYLDRKCAVLSPLEIDRGKATAKAGVETKVTFAGFEDVQAGIVKWPMSVLRISSEKKERLVELAENHRG